jgi:hypothetical protein
MLPKIKGKYIFPTVLNSALRCEGTSRTEGTVASSLFSVLCGRCVISFVGRSLYPFEKNFQYQLNRRVGGFQDAYGRGEKRNISGLSYNSDRSPDPSLDVQEY